MPAKRGMSVLDRFFSYVEPEPNTGCWLWTGVVGNNGYGRFFHGRNLQAHRASYMLLVGEIGDLLVCHKCDNKICVNPDHLFLGTHADNSADMASKGRQARQVRTKAIAASIKKTAKLNDDSVLVIFARRSAGVHDKDIANELGVSLSTIRHVVYGHSWKHVTRPAIEKSCM